MSFASAGFATGVIGSEEVSVRITTLFASRACAVLETAGVVADVLFEEVGEAVVPPLPQLAKEGQAAVSRMVMRLRRRRMLISLLMALGIDAVGYVSPDRL